MRGRLSGRRPPRLAAQQAPLARRLARVRLLPGPWPYVPPSGVALPAFSRPPRPRLPRASVPTRLAPAVRLQPAPWLTPVPPVGGPPGRPEWQVAVVPDNATASHPNTAAPR